LRQRVKLHLESPLIKCECSEECKELIHSINKLGKFAKFKSGHNSKGMNNNLWKGGRYKLRGYWYILMPEYYSSNKSGYVREHIYFYQEFHKCCLLKWSVVHHIIPVKKGGSNMPWNLQGMMRKDHQTIHMKGRKHNKKDLSNRRCSYIECKNPLLPSINSKGQSTWYTDDKGGWLHQKCYRKIYYWKKKLETT
jgi:hypothetical protein